MSLSKKERDALPASAFAVPESRELPMHDRTHVKLAWSSVARTQGLSEAQVSRAKERIITQAKRLGVDTSAWKHETTSGHVFHDTLLELSLTDHSADDSLIRIINESITEMPLSLEEIAGAVERAKQYMRDHKGRFQSQYGSHWREHLWGKVKSMFGVEPVSHHGLKNDKSGVKHESVSLAEITVTVSGPVGSGKSAILQMIDNGLMAKGITAQFDDKDEESEVRDATEARQYANPDIVSGPVMLRVNQESVQILDETKAGDSARKTAWKNRRSMTKDEVERLYAGKEDRKKAAHECGKGYIEGKGYCVYTHRCSSGFYPSPESIPTSKLKFVASTG
jgi:hypothetical protein